MQLIENTPVEDITPGLAGNHLPKWPCRHVCLEGRKGPPLRGWHAGALVWSGFLLWALFLLDSVFRCQGGAWPSPGSQAASFSFSTTAGWGCVHHLCLVGAARLITAGSTAQLRAEKDFTGGGDWGPAAMTHPPLLGGSLAHTRLMGQAGEGPSSRPSAAACRSHGHPPAQLP